MFEESLMLDNFSVTGSSNLSSNELTGSIEPSDLITPQSDFNRLPAVGASLINIEDYLNISDRSNYFDIQSIDLGTLQTESNLTLSSIDALTGQALQSAQGYLSALPSLPDLTAKMQLAFGNNYDLEAVQQLVKAFERGDFSAIPPVKIISREMMNGANGAFDSLNGAIYLSREFVVENANNLDVITDVLLEEIGHYIDSQINRSDSLGDEGEIFAALVQKKELSASAIAEIKAEDDTTIVVIDGNEILIEQSANNADNTIAGARNLGNLSNIQTINDFVGTSDTNDFYRISISNPSTLNLNLSRLSADAKVQLIQDFNNNGVVDPKEVLALSQEGITYFPIYPGQKAQSLNLPLLAGTYYVRVFPGVPGANANYTLSLSASSLGTPNYTDPSSVQSYFGTNVTRTFYNNVGNGASVYQSQFGQFLMYGTFADYYTNNYFKNPDSKNGLFGIYSGLGLPTSSIYVQTDGSQVMEFEGGTLTNRNGIVTPSYIRRNGDRFDLVGQSAPNGTELQWKNDYSWYNRRSVGTPTGSVRRINGGWIQEFTGGSDGNSIFLLKDGQQVLGGTENYTDSNGRSISRPKGGPFRVQGGILNAYLSVGGYERQNNGLGFPTLSTERSDFKGYKTYHEFENGFIGITYDGKTVIQDWQGRPIAPIGKWVAEYYNNPDLRGNQISSVKTFGNTNLNGKPIFSRIEDSINNNWGTGGPGNGIGNDNFSVRWTGDFYFEADTYRFNASMDDGMRLWVDNSLIIDTWNGRNAVDYTVKRPITAGNHTIKVEYREFGGSALAKVNWEKVIPWKAEYFNNGNLTGNAAFVETFGDAQEGLSKNWGSASPNSKVNSDNFSARFTSQLYLAPGLHQIKTFADDGIRVKIGDRWVISQYDRPLGDFSGYFRSAGGYYPIAVEYKEIGGLANLNVGIAPAQKIHESAPWGQWNAQIFHTNGTPPVDFYKDSGNEIGSINLGSNVRSDGKWGLNPQNWGQGAPKGDNKRLPHDWFAIRAYTQYNFEAGKTYKATIRSDDGYQLLAKNHATGEWIYFTPQNQWQLDAYGPKEITFTVPQSGGYDLHFHMFDWGSDSYFDLSLEQVNNYAPASNITYVNFSGRVMPTVGVALRNSPNLNDKVPGSAYAYNQILKFDAWTRGETAIDSKLGTPDNRWFKIAGTNYWVPSAYIDGNPPSSGSGSGGSSGGGTANPNLPVMTIEQFNNWRNLPEYTSRNPFPAKGQNCTWYAHGRLLQLGYSKSALDTMLGNAGTWDERAGEGAFVSSSPKAGAIAVWEAGVNGAGSVGHVAVVEQVNADGTILISESNWANKAYNTRNISANGLKFVIVPSNNISGGNNNSSGGTGNTGGNTGNFIPNPNPINISTYRSVTHADGNFEVRLHPIGNKNGNFSSTEKDIWIVVHGWNNSSDNFVDLAKAIDAYPGEQLVLLLDWSAARTGGNEPNLLCYLQEGLINGINQDAKEALNALNQARRRIDAAADAAFDIIKNKLTLNSKTRLNLIGHSLGAYVSAEIAQRLGGVDRLILLDPANNAFSHYVDDVNVAQVSNISKAFYSSVFGDYARDAHESYVVKSLSDKEWINRHLPSANNINQIGLHGLPIKLYTQMLRSSGNVSRNFGLAVRESNKYIPKDFFNQYGTTESGWNKSKVFEGVIYARIDGSIIGWDTSWISELET